MSLPPMVGSLCLIVLMPVQMQAGDAPARMQVTPDMLQTPKMEEAVGFENPDAKAVFYDGMPWKGKPARVFAWIGFPKGAETGKTKVPGMVLVHGGGGTAFANWVKLWTDRGYAAIAMDTCGNVPRGSYGKWERDPQGGPAHGHINQVQEPMSDQWPYHAVADVLLAHSLLRSFPQVDADRIGLTGISWGGFLTCIVSGLDDRFQFAVPVYGCGYLGTESLLSGAIAADPAAGEKWLAMWDPGHYLPAGKMPKLWVTGTNDRPFPFPALQPSYRCAGGKQTLCIRLRMPHGHGAAGEGPKEIHAFADACLKGGQPLAEIQMTARNDRRVAATFSSSVPIAKGELLYTKDTGPWPERNWEAIPAALDRDANQVAAELPEGARVFFLNIEDDRGLVVSTEHMELESN